MNEEQVIFILKSDWNEKQTKRYYFFHSQNELRAKLNWMTIPTVEREKIEQASERAYEPTTMVPEFLEGRSMNASAHVYHVTLCLYICVIVCVYHSSQLPLWFHISHHQRERERCGEKNEYG